jgi:sugar transferase (PEP-CTERM/EpsH1 system associated)
MIDDAPPLVVHIIYALGTGGLENGLVNIINRAPPERYQHAIICLTKADDFASRLTMPGVRIYALNKRPGQDFKVFWRLLKLLWKLRPAVIHTRNLAALEMQLVGFFIPRARRIHGEHGRDIYDLDGTNRRYLLLRRALKPFIQRYIAVSEDLRSWLIHHIGVPESRVRQIYNGVDRERFFPRGDARPDLAPPGFVPTDGIVLGSVGRLAEVKDQSSILDALDMLIAENPELRGRVRLALIGNGPLFAALQQKAESLGVADLVWMPGDRRDVPELLRMMDIFLLPSLAEGISNTVLEAMASRLPVIATRTGGTPELVDDGSNGLLVPVGDAKALAKSIAKMCVDPAMIKAMGVRGYEKVRMQFDWTRTVEEYLSVYDDVLGAERGDRQV